MVVLMVPLFLSIFLLLIGCNTVTNSDATPSDSVDTSFTVETVLPASNGGEVVRHHDYTLSYSEQHEQAYWVAYIIEPEELQGIAERKDDFRPDPLISTGSATDADYNEPVYDRGHLAPAAVMKRDSLTMSESFYYSNISPQLPAFNRYGGWKQLEKLVRDFVDSIGVLYVITGPVLHNNLETIGDNRVSVPQQFYKVLYSRERGKMVAYLMPHRKITEELSEFIVTVDSVEEVTGLNFFINMDDSLEEDLESSQWSGW